MKQREAEKNTMAAGEVGFEITESDFSHLEDNHYDVPLVVKLGTEYYAVKNFEIKGRKDGSYVAVVTATDSN